MGYIGNNSTVQNFTPAVDYFNGNGSTTSFTLSRTVGSVFDIQAFIENVPQNPSSAFTVTGNVITFTSAPPSGTNNIYVRYTSPVTQLIKPAPGTVGPTELNSAYSLWNLSGANINYTAGSVGIGTSNTFGNSLVSVVQGITAFNAGATTPYFQTYVSTAGSNLKTWRHGGNSSGNYIFETVNDAYSSATERMRIDSSGNLLFNSGYGSVVTAYGCRAWVDFNGTGTVAIRGSGNVTSITDHGTGQYTVNLTTSLPDTNYAIVTSCGTPGQAKISADINNVGDGPFTDSPPTVSSFRFAITRYDSGAIDSKYVSVAVFR